VIDRAIGSDRGGEGDGTGDERTERVEKEEISMARVPKRAKKERALLKRAEWGS
jgi:hypothetical protein